VPGRELRPHEAPQLFAAIEALRRQVDAPGSMRVHLDGEFNAGATETRGLLGVFGTRRVLTLGVPLLACLSRDEVLAILAHEFGHFSRRHGRLGPWLYRARVGWLEYARWVDESDSPFDRAAAWYARAFAPYFTTHGFIYSRRCEYEADADAAGAVGGPAFAAALVHVAVMSRMWEEGLPARLAGIRIESMQAPSDVHQRLTRAATEWPRAELQRWLNEAMAAPSGWTDTHPSLADRLGALHETPRLAETGPDAGPELLGDAWPAVCAEFDAQWQRRAQPSWTVRQLYAKHVVGPLLAAAAGTTAQWPIERQLFRARALRSERPAEGLAALRSLHASYPDQASVALAYGAALLEDGSTEGIPLLERAAAGDPAYRVPAYADLARHFERQGDGAQAAHWAMHRDRALERRGEAIAAFLAEVEGGRTGDDGLGPEQRALLADATRLDPCIAKAWHVGGDAPLATARSAAAGRLRVHALFLSMKPEEAERAGVDEDALAERYERTLAMLIPPHEHGVVRTLFATERTPGFLEARASLSRPEPAC
jgi:Zn-dependent protease with chaperone function